MAKLITVDPQVDRREQTFNQGHCGPVELISTKVENVGQILMIMIDIDLNLFDPEGPFSSENLSPKTFFNKYVAKWLDNHPVLHKAEVRFTGSAGSHCNITLEADIPVLNDPDKFQRRVRHAYGLCSQAVEDELAGLGGKSEPQTSQNRATTAPKTEYRNSKSTEPERNNNRFLATPKQMKFITQLCRGIKGLDNRRLDSYCQQEFGKSSQQLSAQDASKLIDMLKDAKENGGLAS